MSLALGASLAGCAAAEPGAFVSPLPEVPTSAPEPSTSAHAPEHSEQDDIDAAKQHVVEYWATVDRIGQTAENDWEAVGPLMTSDLWMRYGPAFEENASTGLRTEGDVVVESMTVREYLPSESQNERVTIDACVDFGGRTTYDGDGSVIRSRTPDRYLNTYEVVHGGAGSAWMIAEISPQTEETC